MEFHRPTWWKSGEKPRWSWRPVVLPVLSILLLTVLHLVLFPPIRTVEQLRFEAGQIPESELRAPFRFEAPRPEAELEEERTEARSRVQPVYAEVPEARLRSRQPLERFFNRLGEGGTAQQRLLRISDSFPGLDISDLAILARAGDVGGIGAATLGSVRELQSIGVVDLLPRGEYREVLVKPANEGEERAVAVDELILAWRVEEALRERLLQELGDARIADAATGVAAYFLLPDLQFDEEETARRREAAAALVPITRDYARNERILDAGVRVSREQLAVLAALDFARVERALAADRTIALRLRLGRILALLILLGGLAYSLWRIDARACRELRQQLLLSILLALFLAVSAFVLQRDGWGGLAAMPIVLPAMLGTILFGSRTAWRMTTAAILLIVLVPGQSGPMVFAWAVAAGAAVGSVERLRNRNQFYRAIAVVSLAYVVALGGLALGNAESFSAWATAVAPGVASGIVSTVLCLFLLPLLEALFGVTTDLTLLELSDLNHPLLKRMSLESPGTFHHSQVVGTLAEAGARAIGANSLLARVGSNFHDIGKMLKPRYFAENQRDGNAHDELSATMSALVIASHVKDGIQMGRREGLPRSIIAFIPEHHGSSVMQFFYRKALERADGDTIKVDDFRYPGPKPQTRETALCMLADGVEASTRSLRRPTPSRIREMVRKIIDGKMAEGQLDECGLTLSDLAKIRESFIPVLQGIHHQRVAYPGQREHENRKEKESREARARGRRGGTTVAPRT